MDSENIDKVFEAIQKGYNKKLWGLAEMDTTYTTKKWSQFSEEVYTRIMKRIEEGDIEYFFKKNHTWSAGKIFNSEIFSKLLGYSMNEKILKRAIENKEVGLANAAILVEKLGDKEWTLSGNGGYFGY